ncbi:hypothetical protein N5C40_05770 [Pseudomonas fulva]|uniref:hypothetical protein n=1 Tax=Pseudomonas TaxID=286 RepID=UPI000D91F8EF|nr:MULTISPECIES: hypothetical protein [Pseudomonas]MDH1306045.1 hypothetical protein [Pseudomonas fulva]PYB85810.1 hypothetical protein DMX01_19435 [Pseudomonas fulva]PYC12727.1 hypothetical protein DMX00_13955 [Pseudomonas fulva]
MNIPTRITAITTLTLTFMGLQGCGQTTQSEQPKVSNVQLRKIASQLVEANATLKELKEIQAQSMVMQQAQLAAQLSLNQILLQSLNDRAYRSATKERKADAHDEAPEQSSKPR